MFRSLYTAASGMTAQQLNLDNIVNNLANSSTSGFRRRRLQFQDMLYQNFVMPGSAATQQTTMAAGLQIGLGTRTAASEIIQLQGDFNSTGNPLDLSVSGQGFFQVSLPTGDIAYTRSGTFHLDAQGNLVTADGNPLQPGITIPPGATSITIGTDGTVSVTQPGQTAAQQVGQVQLALFPNPGGLNREIVVSCSILTLVPGEAQINPIVFWEHSLGCALVCRQFARKINFPSPEKAYLGGLLHDLGIIVNLWLVPREFETALGKAKKEKIPLHEAEFDLLGLTHCESGRFLAERWALTGDLIEVVSHHHQPKDASSHKALVALVGLSDLLCRMGEIGHGYTEMRQVNFLEEPGFAVLKEECPSLNDFDWARFTFELEGYLEEVRRLVRQLYRPA